MAHFLEHLVFKGGELYDDYRKVNETAEQMGAVLNAYTSHDVVAFHLTCRAEVVPKAIDLLTDFAGRPKIDADELDRERGVVVQEIARAKDTPSVVAEHLIDRAAFGDHPLGRPVLGPPEHIQSFTRDAIVAFRERQWAGSRGGAFLVGNLEHVPEDGVLAEAFGRFPAISPNGGYEPAPTFTPQTLVEERDSNQSHLRISYRPHDRPAQPRAARRAVGLLDAAGRLDGLAAVRRDPRAARARLLGLLGRPHLRRRADPPALGRARVRQDRRGLPLHARDRRRPARERAAPGGVRARPRLLRRPAGAGVREHQRRGALRGQPDRAVRGGHRPRPGDRRARRDDARGASARSPAASPSRPRWPASGRTKSSEFA